MVSVFPQREPQQPAARGWGKRALHLVAALTVGASLVLTPVRSNAAPPDPQLERDLTALTNADRTSNGVPALLIDDRLVTVARDRSDDMVTRNYFAHEIPPTGIRVFEMILSRGVDYEFAAENIGFNNAPRTGTVQHIQGEFLRSPGHRANLLRDRWNFIGVGAVPGTDRVMYTVLFMKPFPSDPAAQLLAPTAPPPDVGPLSQPAVPAISPIERVADSVLGRSLGIPGLE